MARNKDKQPEQPAQTNPAEVAEQPEVEIEQEPTSTAESQQEGTLVTPEMFQEMLRTRDEYLATAQRIQAEFENFKRRNATVRTDSLAEGRLQCITDLLPVLDDLERALQAAKTAGDDTSLTDGVELVQKRMLTILQTLGVTPIDAVGQVFDPMLHEAVMNQPVEDEAEKGKVVAEVRKGYRTEERVLRYSMVVVGQ